MGLSQGDGEGFAMGRVADTLHEATGQVMC